jgi:hypothetical protein
MPFSIGVPRSVVLTHARALTFNAKSIPASWSTFLIRVEGLNYVDLLILEKRLLHERFKPRFGCLPTFVRGVPGWLVAMLGA